MKYVFDWEAFGGCLGTLIVLALIPVGCFVVYFLFNAILFILPAIVAILVILGIIYAIGYAFKEMFFKKLSNFNALYDAIKTQTSTKRGTT